MLPRTVFKGTFKRFNVYSFNIFQQNLTFEDVEAILQILVVVSALIMTFVISFMVGIQRSDLEAGDLLWINHKNMTGKPWLLTIDRHGLWHTASNPFTWSGDGGFVSHVIAYRAVHSMGLLVAIVFLVTISYLSLHISRAREDPEHLQHWLMIGQVVIVASSVMFVVALWLAISAIGNIMGILYPPILMHFTYSDMQRFIAEDGIAGNFAIEPLAQDSLRLYCIVSISAGFALAVLSQLIGGWQMKVESEDVEMQQLLDKVFPGDLKKVSFLAQHMRNENVRFDLLQDISIQDIASLGIKLGDAVLIKKQARKMVNQGSQTN